MLREVSYRGFYYNLDKSPYRLNFNKGERTLVFASESRRRTFKNKYLEGKKRIQKGVNLIGLPEAFLSEIKTIALAKLIEDLYVEERKWHAEKVRLQLSRSNQKATEEKTL